MNVLSLFDGISCGRLALQRAGIEVENYFASEIDKFAIQVSKANWPEIQHIGDVCGVHAADLPKIDLLIGGSPCQGFSFAGKGLNFDDPRSALFFEYVRILNEAKKINPDIIFLLENVPMKREYQMVISKYLGVEPIEINGALVSAQNRRRLFWTNIKAQPFNLFGDIVSMIPQPKDRGILLKDILQPVEEVDKKYYLSESALNRLARRMNGNFSKPCIDTEKSGTATTRSNSGRMNLDSGTTLVKIDVDGRVSPNQNKSGCFTAGGNSAGNHSDMDLIFIEQTPNLRVHNMMPRSSKTGKGGIGHLSKDGGKTYCIDTGQTNVIEFFSTEITGKYRRLTPVEVERLFTLPDGYTSVVSDSQRYRCMGNGWVVDVISHILIHIQ